MKPLVKQLLAADQIVETDEGIVRILTELHDWCKKREVPYAHIFIYFQNELGHTVDKSHYSTPDKSSTAAVSKALLDSVEKRYNVKVWTKTKG